MAKLILEQTTTFLERQEAVETAMSMGMPLNEIEEYLDWLDTVKPVDPDTPDREDEGDDSSRT